MSEEEDFDIVPDEDEAGPRSTWLWVTIITVVALFAFGVGVAFMILSDRIGPGSPTATPDLSVIVPTPVSAITDTLPLTPNAVITVSGTPTQTPTLTVTPTATLTPTPTCTQAVEEQFIAYYDASHLGCATSAPNVVWSAYQPFERGSMLWRADHDTSYVFYASGAWMPIEQGWDGGPMRDRGEPPPGLQAPQRGFGWVWSHSDEMFSGLGWALDQEKGFCALVQDFERGFILRSSDLASCTAENLYNFATAPDWATLLIIAVDDAQWQSSALTPNAISMPAATITTEPTALPSGIPVNTSARPAPNGAYNARSATGYTIDGRFEEWPGEWIPMNSVVFGADRHDRPADLSGNFQIGWNANGLMLAIRVNDDVYRAGPQGSDLWQGDSVEIQFDRQLAEDFDSTLADADDYQVGIAFDLDGGTTFGYLWLPFEREAQLSIPSAVTIDGNGYQLEVMIPWYVFEITEPATGHAYGFNISVNDNDSEGPAQETVISASPARTTHNNPTQWGTLRLIP